jgi:hydrogenase maturation protein HypF
LQLRWKEADDNQQHRRLQTANASLIRSAASSVAHPELEIPEDLMFDAVAALLGFRERVSYEAQAAMELEMLARSSTDDGCYPFELRRQGRSLEIGTRPLFESLIRDILRRESVEMISRRFHAGVVRTFVALAGKLGQVFSLHRVCLSGGTFQNALLLEHLICGLESEGFVVFTHSEVPTGDGGLSLGQALVARPCGSD